MKNKVECLECGASGEDVHRLAHAWHDSDGNPQVQFLDNVDWFCDVCESEVCVKVTDLED